MVNLTNLIGLKGAISAAECKPDGVHISYMVKGNQTQDQEKMTERFCAINALMTTAFDNIDRISNLTLAPFRGWAFFAGDYSVFVASQIILIVETDKADFNNIYKVLSEETGIVLEVA
jgi:roadblock/LC7 domain-containing protein